MARSARTVPLPPTFQLSCGSTSFVVRLGRGEHTTTWVAFGPPENGRSVVRARGVLTSWGVPEVCRGVLSFDTLVGLEEKYETWIRDTLLRGEMI